MPQKKATVVGAMFDVKPVNESGSVDVSKVNLDPVINLKLVIQQKQLSVKESIDMPAEVTIDKLQPAKEEAPSALGKDSAAKELEEAFNEEIDATVHLVKAGATILTPQISKPRLRPILNKAATPLEDKLHQKIISELRVPYQTRLATAETVKSNDTQSTKVESKEPVERQVYDFYKNSPGKNKIITPHKKRFFSSSWFRLSVVALLVLGVYFGKHGFDIRSEVVKDGASAVQNLETAGENIKTLNFASASYNFTEAYEAFSKAGNNLNFLGEGLSALISDLPGAGKLKSAKNILEVGKLMADAGKAMADAVNAVSKTGSILNPSLAQVNSEVMGSLRNALLVSDKNLTRANLLLSEVDTSIIPEDNRSKFEEFRSRLPEFEAIVHDGLGYVEFLEQIISGSNKKYVLLFQNYSEIRPTGGFPGSYGVIAFENGALKEFKVDDVYNLDGQLKENIIPPKPLQHITPTWGMRDANWFTDFPTSAKKILSFFRKEAGYEANGVITISPRIVMNILKIVGPIEMPKYNLTLTSENFLPTIQEEIEYGPNRTQPKTILVEMAPILLEKLYSAPQEKWLEVFEVIVAGLEEKDILMYFKDLAPQDFAKQKGFSGTVDQEHRDYLMVNLSNVKGSKTDAVTDSSLKVDTYLKDGGINHKVTITRKHNGGSTEYGFYNKRNPAYVRVLVPEGSTLLNIKGNAKPNYQPLIEYGGSFKKDPDLTALEAGEYLPDKDVLVYKEAGKTGFGFWMITDAGETEVVEFEYSIPLRFSDTNYEILVQSQPGLKLDNFEFVLNIPQAKIKNMMPVINSVGDTYTYNGNLAKDFLLRFDFQ